MEREREDLEDALTEAEEVAAAVDSIPGRRIRCGTLHVHSGCWSVRGRAPWPRHRCLREQRVW